MHEVKGAAGGVGAQGPSGQLDIGDLVDGGRIRAMHWRVIALGAAVTVIDGIDLAAMGMVVPPIAEQWAQALGDAGVHEPVFAQLLVGAQQFRFQALIGFVRRPARPRPRQRFRLQRGSGDTQQALGRRAEEGKAGTGLNREVKRGGVDAAQPRQQSQSIDRGGECERGAACQHDLLQRAAVEAARQALQDLGYDLLPAGAVRLMAAGMHRDRPRPDQGGDAARRLQRLPADGGQRLQFPRQGTAFARLEIARQDRAALGARQLHSRQGKAVAAERLPQRLGGAVRCRAETEAAV